MKSLKADYIQTGNHLLAALTPADFNLINSSLERVDLPRGQTLIKPYTPIKHVYFPERGMVSLVQPLADGALVEVGVVGKEGMVGSAVLLGTDQWPIEAMVQMPGAALRLPTDLLLEVMRQNEKFRESLLLFVQSLFVHICQSTACNARHRVDQRLARWLLVARDRADGDELPISHAFLAIMLGIRRAGVTVSMSKFRNAGLIGKSPGRVNILDQRGLEEIACECYRVVKEESERLAS